MRMTYTSFMQFYENVDMSMLWSIWSPWWNKRGATTTTTKMVPRQHSGDLTTRRDVGAKESVDVRNMQKMVGWSRITGFPRVDDMANEEERAKTSRTRCKHGYLIHHSCIRSRRSSRWLYLRRVQPGWDEFDAMWMKVDVLATVVEVVVHESKRK